MNANQTIPVPLSVVILTHNEERNIRRCVEAVSWAADVVVVDDASTDNTVAIAQNAGARVVEHQFESFASQRNWAMDFGDIQHDWVLHLDADEVVTETLRHEIESQLIGVSDQVVAFRMCRKTMLNGQWLKYSDGFPVWIMRLVRNGEVWFEDSGHGEVAVPSVNGQMLAIKEPFLHFAFSKGLENWIDRHNRYSSREAALEASSESQVSISELFHRGSARRRTALRNFGRRLPFRGFLRFLYQYVGKLGFLDGRAGWTFSQLMATYETWIVLKKAELQSQMCEIESPAVIAASTAKPEPSKSEAVG